MADEPKPQEKPTGQQEGEGAKPAEGGEPKPDPRDAKIAELEASHGELTRRLETQAALLAGLAAGGAGSGAGVKPEHGQEPPEEFDFETFREKARDDPAAALDYYHQLRVAPLEQEVSSLRTEKTLDAQAAKLAESELPQVVEHFRRSGVASPEKYVDEAKAWMARADPRFRASKGAWSVAFATVLASKIPDLLKEAKTPPPTSPALEKGGPAAAPGAKPPTLTPEEKRVAEGLGMSEEDYINWKVEEATT